MVVTLGGTKISSDIPDKWAIQSLIHMVYDCKLVAGSVSPSLRRLLHICSWAVERECVWKHIHTHHVVEYSGMCHISDGER